jgi:glycosyltransferase involved in cell wall biosynthesis
MNELDLSNRIQFIGYVEDDDLPIMYNLAKIFVFPSLYEGFGLPPLEAMKCGCPVIVPDSTAFPEVVGDAAIKIKNISVVKLTESINEALKNKKDYFQIIKKGIIQTQKFNWKYECEKIHKLYAHCSTND